MIVQFTCIIIDYVHTHARSPAAVIKSTENDVFHQIYVLVKHDIVTTYLKI